MALAEPEPLGDQPKALGQQIGKLASPRIRLPKAGLLRAPSRLARSWLRIASFWPG
jgi:hypothetical protein